jgi:two-component system sensor histidine kinase ChvG
MLTAMTPVHANGNCWVVISSENAASLTSWPVGSSFWNTPVLRVAAIIYLLSTVLLIGLFIQMWRNVERFRLAARRIRMQGAQVSFRKINSIPELTRVTEDFDSLVDALIASQKRTREAAEENSHALKTPLAVIAQSVEPLKRAVPPSAAAAQRSIDLI